MKINYLIIIISLLLLSSCEKDESKPEEEVNITIRVFCKTKESPNNQFIDEGAKVFIYYGFYSVDIVGFDFLPDGTLVKGDSIIEPAQSAIIKQEGEVVIIPKFYNQKLTIIVESNYYKGVSSCDSFYDASKPVITNFVFQ